jgi:imidazolonepropionase
VAATRAATDAELASLARARLDRFVAHGVTTVEAKSGYGLTPGNERRLLQVATGLDHAVDVVSTFMGAHVVPEQYEDAPEEYVELVIEMLPSVRKLATFCDVWCDRGAFTVEQSARILIAARKAGLGLKVHAEQMGRTGGAAMAASLEATSADHLEHVSWDDAEALARAGVVAVLLPGASMMTGAPFANARLLIERGVRVALSTDFNPGSSYSENLQLTVALACVHLKMTPEEAILAVTRIAAAAIAREGKIGSLEPGTACDLVVLDGNTELDLAYHYGVNLAARVVVGGVEVRAGAVRARDPITEEVAAVVVDPGREPSAEVDDEAPTDSQQPASGERA